MQDFREEESLGKAYDARLMRRLLAYARPHWRVIVVCIALLGVISAVDLARPYLLKVAIDDHLNGAGKVMEAYAPGQAPPDRGPVYHFGGRDFERTSGDPKGDTYQLLLVQGTRVLIHGSVAQGAELQTGDPVTAGTVNPLPLTLDGSHALAAVRVTPPGGAAPYQVTGVLLPAAEVAAFQQGDASAIWVLAASYALLLLLELLLNYVQALLLQNTGQRIIFRIRQDVFSHLQRLPLAFFDKNPVGRLVTRVANDTEALSEMYTSVLVNLFKDIFLLGGIAIVMLQLDLRMGLVSLTLMPVIAVITWIYQQKARDAWRVVRVKLAMINATLAENISGMRIVQIFRREREQGDEFHTVNQAHFDAGMRQLYIFAVFRPLLDLLAMCALALVIWYGGGRLLLGSIEFGVLIAFTSYIQQFFRPLQELADKFAIMQQAMASSERIFQLLDTEPSVADRPDAVVLPPAQGGIEFDHVWFAYEGENWVLRDVSFRVEPGQTVAFVGHTGAGKSSIMNLAARFYDVQQGAVKVDGIDVKDVTQESLRRNIGVVLQDVFLFTGDIKGNIRLNATHISEDAMCKAAEAVGADPFIRRLPQGYDEPVVERGATLSAGERQLLAFARALAFNPAILVLDEATANIDSETEHLIQHALQELTRGRTTLIVAHRLSTIQNADQIIVLHKGKIREQGTHQELLAKQGLYYKLWRLQFEESREASGGAGSRVAGAPTAVQPAIGD
ncbi:MAG: ABC transporter ATP-binding protein [Symbiobacteriia bacterium]